jgi:hypothetical protein
MRLVFPVYVCHKATPVTPTSSREGIFCRADARRNPHTRGDSANRRRLVFSDARKSHRKRSEEWPGATAPFLVSSSPADYSTTALAPRCDSDAGVPILVRHDSPRLQVDLGSGPIHQRLAGKVPGRRLQLQNQISLAIRKFWSAGRSERGSFDFRGCRVSILSPMNASNAIPIRSKLRDVQSHR